MSAKVTINGKEYPLLLTTRATRHIAERYGGLDMLGDKLLKSENFEAAIEEIVWLVCELANQYITVEEFILKGKPVPLLSEDMVEAMTTPYDLTLFKDAILEAFKEGMERSVQSEAIKNTKAG